MASKQLARQAADDIAKLSGAANHEAVVVLGSGWTDALDSLGDVVWRTPAESITGFIAATMPGHTGELVSVDLKGHRVLVFSGRTHLYEGNGVDAVVHPIPHRCCRRLPYRRAHQRQRLTSRRLGHGHRHDHRRPPEPLVHIPARRSRVRRPHRMLG